MSAASMRVTANHPELDLHGAYIGGGAETPVKMFSGSSEASLGTASFTSPPTPFIGATIRLPIAYTVAFPKTNRLRAWAPADYTETVCVRFNNGFVRFDHAGGYVAKFEIDWGAMPKATTQNRQWTSGEKTAGYSESIDIPGDAKNVHLKAWAMTGLVWDPWGEILNIVVDGPDNKTYRVTGTTLDRHWDNPTS
jgi:thiol-activated cytolysin